MPEWIAPKTWLPDDYIPSSDLNAFWRDNPLLLYSKPAARIFYSEGNQALENQQDTALMFNSERYDNFDARSDEQGTTTQMVCRHDGIYLIGANVSTNNLPIGGSGSLLYVMMNGHKVLGASEHGTATTNEQHSVGILHQLAVGDYVECMVVNRTGAAGSVLFVNPYTPEFWMAQLARGRTFSIQEGRSAVIGGKN